MDVDQEHPLQRGRMNMSAFSASDMEFLNFETNDDSLDLSLSGSHKEAEAFNGVGDISGILSSVVSQDSSNWAPSNFSNASPDEFIESSDDILADLHLPSLGEAGAARKIISALLNDSPDTTPRHSPHHRYFPAPASYTKEGHVALQHMNNDLRLAREQAAALKVQAVELQKKHLASREELADLDIGESLYHQLEKLSPAEMTLREYVCHRAASVYLPLRKKVQSLERDLQEVQVQLELSSGTVESQGAELSRQRKMGITLQETLRLDLSAAEERGDRLSTRLQVEIAKRQEREAQAARCDEALADAEAMRKEAAILRSTVDEQSTMLQTLTTSDRRHADLLADVTRAKELLAMDKTYLQRELGEVTTSAHEHSRRVDSLQAHIEKLDAKILSLTDQLVGVQMSTRTAFDERMEKEVTRLREDYDKDMTCIKDTSKEISDHENRMLREIRQTLEKELESGRRRLDDKERALADLTRELNEVRSAADSELSMLRAEVKMKHFEVTSLGATFEERSSQLKLSQLDLDVLREEVGVHKSALLRMESESASRVEKLQEELARAHETIRAYDVLFSDEQQHGGAEEELHTRAWDEGRRGSGGEDACCNDEDWEEEVKAESEGSGQSAGSGRVAPRSAGSSCARKHSLSVLASNPAKFRHFLDSSERNIETIRELNQRVRELAAKNAQLLKDKKGLKEEISRNIRELSLVPMSNKHVIGLFTQKDDECRLLHSRLAAAEAEMVEQRSSLEATLGESAALREKVGALVCERRELEGLRVMLEEFQRQTDALGEGAEEDARKDVGLQCFASDDSLAEREASLGEANIVQSALFRNCSEELAQDSVRVVCPEGDSHSEGGVHSLTGHADRPSISTAAPAAAYRPHDSDNSPSKLASLGMSPLVLKTMTERHSSGPTISSPGKKIGFHLRSPAGK